MSFCINLFKVNIIIKCKHRTIGQLKKKRHDAPRLREIDSWTSPNLYDASHA